MSAEPAFEGPWEEVLTHAQELRGRRVRLYILADEVEPYPGVPADKRPSDAGSLLRFAGTWVGDDLPDRLADVLGARSEARF